MIKITIEYPGAGVKQLEADGVYISVVKGNKSTTLIATDYKKENFNPNIVVGSLVCLVDKTIRDMTLSEDAEAAIKAAFMAMWEDVNSEKMNKIKKIKEEIDKDKEGKRCQE